MIPFPAALVPFKGYLVGGVAVLLALSLIGNAVQYHLVESANEDRTKAEGIAQSNFDAAKQCNDGVDELKKTADANAKKSAVAIAAAKTAQRTTAARAQELLSAPATVPGNACQSATDRATRWLNESP